MSLTSSGILSRGTLVAKMDARPAPTRKRHRRCAHPRLKPIRRATEAPFLACCRYANRHASPTGRRIPLLEAPLIRGRPQPASRASARESIAVEAGFDSGWPRGEGREHDPPALQCRQREVRMTPDELAPAPTAATRAAREVVGRYSSAALVNHCERSYLWSAALGRLSNVAFDSELLYVASMLHDLGLVDAFDNHSAPFEDAGGDVGWVFAAGAGWSAQRRERVKEIIVRHMW